MRVVTGTVVGGKVEFSDESIEEGAQVMVLAPATGALTQLSPAEEEELTEAMEQIRGGEYVEAEDLLNELRSWIRA